MKDYVNCESYYEPETTSAVNNTRTRKRLEEISKLGFEESGVGQFGIPKVMSGLYVEMIWSYSDKNWNDYINWVKDLKKSANQEQPKTVSNLQKLKKNVEAHFQKTLTPGPHLLNKIGHAMWWYCVGFASALLMLKLSLYS